MQNTIMVASLVSLLCFSPCCRSNTERAGLEEQNVEKLAHGHEADVRKAPAIRQDEMTHPEEEKENLLQPPERIMDAIGLKPGGTLAIVLDDPAKSGGESARSATREEFPASVDKAGYKVEKEETFLQRDGLFVLRSKSRRLDGVPERIRTSDLWGSRQHIVGSKGENGRRARPKAGSIIGDRSSLEPWA